MKRNDLLKQLAVKGAVFVRELREWSANYANRSDCFLVPLFIFES